MDQFNKEDMLQGQSEAWMLMYAFSHSMALRCAVDLHIPDIIHSHGGPMTLPHIVSEIGSKAADASRLERIMRLLVRKKVFTAHKMPNGGETLYGLTPTSSWFLRVSELSLVPMILMHGHEISMKPWQYLSKYVGEGGSCFEMANDGHDLWESTSKDAEFNKAFNDGMACTAKIMIKAIIEECKHVFEPVSSLVDVGGGTGAALAEIVKAYPHIKGINFDQPHVVATAKKYDGITHVGGNFFEAIPAADAVFMKVYKSVLSYLPDFVIANEFNYLMSFPDYHHIFAQWILHDWEDDNCVRILKNCRKALPEGNGKVILSEIVVDPEGNGLFDEMGIILDLTMITHTDGKERTESEWRSLLERGGFPRCNVLKIPGLFAIIQGFPI